MSIEKNHRIGQTQMSNSDRVPMGSSSDRQLDASNLVESKLDEMVAVVRQRFPDWNRFDDPRFMQDEVTYKQGAVAKMGELLGKEELGRLLQAEAYDEIIEQIRKVAASTNLLYLSTPNTGDLRILVAPGLDKAAFCREFANLLYGDGSGEQRLESYLGWVVSASLPNQWTFPTYFLFFASPQSEFFVKPSVISWWLAYLGAPQSYSTKPTLDLYVTLKDIAHALYEMLTPFGPRDMTDIQSFIWVVYNHLDSQEKIVDPLADVEPELASPFDAIFADWDEANWAFDFLYDVVTRLGASGSDDPRFALTLPYAHGGKLLRLNFGQWLILDVNTFQSNPDDRVSLALIKNHPALRAYVGTDGFSQRSEEIRIAGYYLPIDDVRWMAEPLTNCYQESMGLIGKYFQNWKGTPFRHAHQQRIFDAIFDEMIRAELLSTGIEVADINDPPRNENTEVDMSHDNAPFSAPAFELLAQLRADPTAEFYQSHKNEFVELVEQPFQRLLRHVAQEFPTPILHLMETEKRLFGRFTKNDFGQGGAWPFYWGAFYPKGSKRSQDAQLSMWVDADFLEFGFYIGEYGSAQRKRFERNCKQHQSALRLILADALGDERLIFGSRDEFIIGADGTVSHSTGRTWQDFLADPAAANCDVSIVIPRRELLSLSEYDLLTLVRHTHIRLFPLVLLAVEEDPVAAIAAYFAVTGIGDIADEGDDDEGRVTEPYTRNEFLRQTCLGEVHADEIWDLLHDKKQVIFFGPPGTGKSYVAQHLAHWVTERADFPPDQVEMIQFHPAYSYEDFIEGIRPVSKPAGEGRFVVDYPVQAGVFRRFCERAARNPDKPHVFIIDEINRGNIPRIFGELMLLLEYRNRNVALPYSGTRFSIPENVYLIATMNTADRSIALVDFALRRRFHFIRFAADPDLFERWLERNPSSMPYLGELYRRISQDAIDDENFAIGPSYFMDPQMDEAKLARIWRYSIEPYLEEYYVGQPSKVAPWRWDGANVNMLRSSHE
jgi:hypothetical protein